jgi:hypothetical protein
MIGGMKMLVKTILVAYMLRLYYKKSMKRKTPTLIEDSPAWMEAILIALNGELPLRRAEMRRLVKAWQDSERNVRKMLRIVPELKPYLFAETGWPPCRALLFPEGSGLRIILMPEGPNVSMSREELIEDEARLMFLQLLLNPLRDKLSERPCARCGNYYLKKTARQEVYSQRKCAKNGTAAFATKKRLQEQHSQKLRVAAELASKWTTARTKDGWKQWVSKQPAGVKEEISSKFLTRAVNHYGLVEPKKGR